MPKVTVHAFDPGKTTGYASITVTEDGKNFDLRRCEEIPWDNRLSWLFQLFIQDVISSDIIVMETFRLFPDKATSQIGSQFPSVQMIGNIEAFAFNSRVEPERIKYQEPGDISKVMVLERDLKMVAGSPHKIDAYRHARLYFLKHFYMNPFA